MRRAGVTTLAILALGCAGCGRQSSTSARSGPAAAPGSASSAHARPQAIEPVAGHAAPGPATGAAAGAGGGAGAGGVSVGSNGGALSQPVSDATIRRQLAASGLPANPNQATLTSDGLAIAPIGAPAEVQEVIQAGNEIARLPYRYGGGHITYEDTAYDCSGSISFVFQAAHLLNTTVVSGDLMNWGSSGPGKWITVFANAGHTFMYVAGLRFDTVALAETGSRWSNRPANEPDLRTFAVRHPPGL
jgi:hypothetical protein